MIAKSTLILTACLCFGAPGHSQHTQDICPGPVSGASFVFHPQSDAMLLIGGTPVLTDSVRADVWKLDGERWSRIAAQGPGSRSFFPAVLNARTGDIQCFAGMASITDTPKGDMWSFDGQRWTRLYAGEGETQDHHNMVYMDHLDAFLVYGGNRNGYPRFDSVTRIVKNGEYTVLNVDGPGVRWHHGLVYDKKRKKVILYGGGKRPGELWEFDGARWKHVRTPNGPGNLHYHSMVYDETLQATVVHGGWRNQDPRDSVNHGIPATWTWNGENWKRITQQPVYPMAMGYDPGRKAVLAYGFSDPARSSIRLWQLKDGQWEQLHDYGKWDEVEYIRSHLREKPGDVQALMKYADMMEWRERQFDEAEKAYRTLAKLYPENVHILTSLAYVLAAQGKTGEAQPFLEQLRQMGRLDHAVYERLAGRLYMEKRYNESALYYRELLALRIEAKYFSRLARAYAMSEQSDSAFQSLHQAISRGFNVRDQLETDPALSSLRSDPRFKELVLKANER